MKWWRHSRRGRFLSISPLGDAISTSPECKRRSPKPSKSIACFPRAIICKSAIPMSPTAFPRPSGRPLTLFWINTWAIIRPARPRDLSGELPRDSAAASRTKRCKAFSVVPGFHVELAAAEPVVQSPVAVDFDENGAMFVVEMVRLFRTGQGLSRHRPPAGRHATATAASNEHGLVDHLSWPTAVICCDGGVFVGAAPDIWYCKDTDGDGQADCARWCSPASAAGTCRDCSTAFIGGSTAASTERPAARGASSAGPTTRERRRSI